MSLGEYFSIDVALILSTDMHNRAVAMHDYI